MKTTWIVGGLLLAVLLLLTLRERFESYEDALKDVGQTAGYVTPSCPAGTTLSADNSECKTTDAAGKSTTVPPTCPSGSTFVKRGTSGVCEPVAAAPSLDAPVPGSTGVGAVTGTTTGGTSGVTFGPTNESKMVGRKVWGPASKGLGEAVPGAPTAGDSSKSTPYPVLLGGQTGKSSTRIEGVGIVPPSGSGLGGILPSSAALGTDANSGFLPYSRQPGDQDLIPDPYRLAKNFSTSSYTASKTDPVPFLTDFSAFYK
jgi:hypothetical protein